MKQSKNYLLRLTKTYTIKHTTIQNTKKHTYADSILEIATITLECKYCATNKYKTTSGKIR